MPKLTKRFVESAVTNQDRQKIFWDSELKGFGLVVLPSGRCTYCVQYRNQQRKLKRLKIGVHGHISAEQAREIAKIHLGRVAHGEDPASQKKDRKNKASMNDLIMDYLEGHALKKREKSVLEDKKLIRNIIEPNFGSRIVDDISKKDIESLHTKLAKTPYLANRALALLSKMFTLAVSWGWRPNNPVQGIEKYQEEKRDRWLDEEELQRFWDVLKRYPTNTTAILLKFLLLTGARKGEAMNATWDQFDLKQGVWTKPSHLTKQKKKEHLPLSKEALRVLGDLKKHIPTESRYLFPGKIKGEPLKEIKNFWKTVLLKADIKNFRIHDLRHTHASHLVSSGLSLSIVGKLLGHTQASTTQRYAHLADEPLREAANFFGEKVEKLTSNK